MLEEWKAERDRKYSSEGGGGGGGDVFDISNSAQGLFLNLCSGVTSSRVQGAIWTAWIKSGWAVCKTTSFPLYYCSKPFSKGLILFPKYNLEKEIPLVKCPPLPTFLLSCLPPNVHKIGFSQLSKAPSLHHRSARYEDINIIIKHKHIYINNI